jgi:hypothetical protein
MKTYTVKMIIDGINIQEEKLPCPSRLPNFGDEYEVVKHFYTSGKHIFIPGDVLRVLDRTLHAPHNRVSSLSNLIIKSKYDVSIWTSFEFAIATGYLRLKT